MHFVLPVHGRVLQRIVMGALVLTGALTAGCSPRATPAPPEDSLTSGRIKVVCASEARALMGGERDAFQAFYPESHIELDEGSSRDAIAALFAARGDLAVITRDLTPDERSAAVRGRLELEGYRFARDAVVAVVHPDNPVQNLTVEELQQIYEGKTSSWAAFGGRDEKIVPVVQPESRDVTEFVEESVMDGVAIRARSIEAASDSEVVAAVRSRPGAIGYVTLAWADRGARPLRLARLRGLEYWKPDLEAVYRGDYPLTRFFSLYVRASGKRLAHGWITFVTSFDGQKRVHEFGFVPTAVPVRFVRRSPLLGTH
jgi:phosphate transport system substrate-binding protein